MTSWENVLGSQPTRPREWDVDSSKTTVYQRRNIRRVTVTDDDGTTAEMWQYEERQMTHEEYALIRDERLDQLRADVDFLFAMTDIEP